MSVTKPVFGSRAGGAVSPSNMPIKFLYDIISRSWILPEVKSVSLWWSWYKQIIEGGGYYKIAAIQFLSHKSQKDIETAS